MKLTIFLLGMMMVGCSTLPPTKWQHREDSIETYDECIDTSIGKVLITVVQQANKPTAPFVVFDEGARSGEYITAYQAKKAAVKVHPECKEEPFTP